MPGMGKRTKDLVFGFFKLFGQQHKMGRAMCRLNRYFVTKFSSWPFSLQRERDDILGCGVSLSV